MKNAKTVFQILCLVICTLTFTNCQDDTTEENQEQLHLAKERFPYISSLVYTEQLETNSKLNDQIRDLTILQSNINFKSASDTLYDFSVNPNVVYFIENLENNSHSYTFSVKRASNTKNMLENLVFTYDSNTEDYSASLVTYHFTLEQKKEFLLMQHVRSTYEISYEPIDLNLSDVLDKNSMPLACTTNFSVYHITPEPNSRTFLQSSTIGNVHNDCQHEDADGNTECTTYTIVTYDCPDGGSTNVTGSTSTTSSGGNSSGNNLDDPQPIITTPYLDLGDWLIENLGIGNLNASSDEQAIANWIENNDQRGNELFFEVYEFYIENESEPNINDIVSDVILILNANQNLTFEEALFQAGFVIIDSEPTKVDPVVELNCFDLTQGAKLTVYVQQPRENSDVVVGPNQVGHAFIGIEQGGVIRQVGYYPVSGANTGLVGVGVSYDAEVRTNYNYLHHVSISQDISSTQLTNIVNYIINFPPTYNVNNYACTDFAINIGNLGGMNLPSTTVSYLTFSGRSPGVLGQEIRARSSTSTTTITTTSANSSSRQGGCLGTN